MAGGPEGFRPIAARLRAPRTGVAGVPRTELLGRLTGRPNASQVLTRDAPSGDGPRRQDG
jgi:hypothetical protein